MVGSQFRSPPCPGIGIRRCGLAISCVFKACFIMFFSLFVLSWVTNPFWFLCIMLFVFLLRSPGADTFFLVFDRILRLCGFVVVLIFGVTGLSLG